MCEHATMVTTCQVHHFEDNRTSMAEIQIACGDCGEQFQFLGLPVGGSLSAATVGVDATELRLPIVPASMDMGMIPAEGKPQGPQHDAS